MLLDIQHTFDFFGKEIESIRVYVAESLSNDLTNTPNGDIKIKFRANHCKYYACLPDLNSCQPEQCV